MTASTDTAVRRAAAALGDPSLSVSVTEFLATMEASRRAWEERLSAAIPCTSLDDDLFADEDSWVSPMAGHPQPPVVMDWAGLDWSRSRGGAA